MNNVTEFLETQAANSSKSVPVLVLSEQSSRTEVLADFVHKNGIGLVTLDAANLQDYFSLDDNNNLVTTLFADKVRESLNQPIVLAIDHIQRVNRSTSPLVRAIAHAVTHARTPWLYKGSHVVFLDYHDDPPHPFFLSDCNISVLEL